MITEELTFSGVSFCPPELQAAAAVRTARRLVLAQQSACFDAPAATRTQRNVFVLSRSAACWDGSGGQRASVGSVLGERLQVQKEKKLLKLQSGSLFYFIFYLSWYLMYKFHLFDGEHPCVRNSHSLRAGY